MEKLAIKPTPTRIRKAPLIGAMVILGIAGFGAAEAMQHSSLFPPPSSHSERVAAPVLPAYATAENVSVEVPSPPPVAPIAMPMPPERAAVIRPSLPIRTEHVQTLRVFGFQVFRYVSKVEGKRP